MFSTLNKHDVGYVVSYRRINTADWTTALSKKETLRREVCHDEHHSLPSDGWFSTACCFCNEQMQGIPGLLP